MTDAVEGAAPVESVEASEPVGEQVTSVEGTEPVEVPSQEPVGSEAPQDLFEVKVGDQVQQVTLEDLRSGFMRQADYTRKTQEVAAMRQRLQQAEAIANSLETDPQGTLRALAEAFGVGVDQDGEPVEVDPAEQRIAAIERQFQAQEQARVRAEIDSEINALLDKHGDFDLAKVIQHAAQNGMTVTSAYRDLHFDSVAQRQQAEQQVLANKREAAVVEGGSHRTGIAPQQAKAAGSIREAWALAKQSLGVS